MREEKVGTYPTRGSTGLTVSSGQKAGGLGVLRESKQALHWPRLQYKLYGSADAPIVEQSVVGKEVM